MQVRGGPEGPPLSRPDVAWRAHGAPPTSPTRRLWSYSAASERSGCGALSASCSAGSRAARCRSWRRSASPSTDGSPRSSPTSRHPIGRDEMGQDGRTGWSGGSKDRVGERCVLWTECLDRRTDHRHHLGSLLSFPMALLAPPARSRKRCRSFWPPTPDRAGCRRSPAPPGGRHQRSSEGRAPSHERSPSARRVPASFSLGSTGTFPSQRAPIVAASMWVGLLDTRRPSRGAVLLASLARGARARWRPSWPAPVRSYRR